MKLEQIKERVERIKSMAGDDEMAHGEEDYLREDFIKFIAETQNEALAEKARLVLSTNELDFERWCA